MLRRGIDKAASILCVFRRNAHGVAAIEFALILPFGLVLFTGAVEYGDAIAIDRKVTLTTRTVTDLVTQYPTIATADLLTLMGASTQIIAPYSAANVVVIVSQVQVDSGGKSTVSWSKSLPPGHEETLGQQPVSPLPTNIQTPGSYYIWGEVRYTYTPTIGYMLTQQSFNLHDQTFMAPRVAIGGIACNDCP
jgi:Flp pilus assembly protein TadG